MGKEKPCLYSLVAPRAVRFGFLSFLFSFSCSANGENDNYRIVIYILLSKRMKMKRNRRRKKQVKLSAVDMENQLCRSKQYTDSTRTAGGLSYAGNRRAARLSGVYNLSN